MAHRCWTSAPGCTDGSPFDDLDTKSPGSQTSSFADVSIARTPMETTSANGSMAARRESARRAVARTSIATACSTRPTTARQFRDHNADGCQPDQDGDGIVDTSDEIQVKPEGRYAPSSCPDGDSDTVLPLPGRYLPDGQGDRAGRLPRWRWRRHVGSQRCMHGNLRSQQRLPRAAARDHALGVRARHLPPSAPAHRGARGRNDRRAPASSLEEVALPVPQAPRCLAGKKPTNFASAFRNHNLRTRNRSR